jgi:hypothetical protein
MSALVKSPPQAEALALEPCETKNPVAGWLQDLKNLPQVACPLTHLFAPGVYLRQIAMPAGTLVIGKIHRTEHFNVIERGKFAIRHDDGRVETLQAPVTFVSKAGVQKVLYIIEDTVWKTIHATSETDLEKLEALLIEAPAALEALP